MSDDSTVTVRIACRTCSGAGNRGLMRDYIPQWGANDYEVALGHRRGDVFPCSACRGTGVAAERIVPACAEPFPLARPEDD